MTQDTDMLDSQNEDGGARLELELQYRSRQPSSPTADAPVFDPIRCAELHNKIIQRILRLQPSWRPHVKRNLFKVPPHRFLLEKELYTNNATTPQESVSEEMLRDRIGGDLSTFFELIDIISLETEHFIDHVRQVTYQTPFLAFFDSPNPALFYDFSDVPSLEDHPYVIQLYPTSYIFACEAQAGGIMFDMSLGLATFARPLDSILPEQNSWVPLDIVLSEWLKIIDAGKIYWRDGELDEWRWTSKSVDSALAEWNEYLDLLERKVEKSGVKLQRGSVSRMFNDEALEKWVDTMHPLAVAFLKQARSPARGINRIGPGLTFYNSDSFNAMHEARKTTDSVPTEDLEILKERNLRQDMIRNEWLTTLLFPADGEHSTLQGTPNPPYGNIIDQSELLNKSLGVYIVGETDCSAVIDHEGRTQTFQRRDRCPWGSISDLPLADMFRAWTIMLESGHWRVGPDGVKDDYTWFARHKEIEWIANTRWNPGLVNANGEDIGEMKNDWVEWNGMVEHGESEDNVTG